MFSRFDKLHEHDRQTARHCMMATRGKNEGAAAQAAENDQFVPQYLSNYLSNTC